MSFTILLDDPSLGAGGAALCADAARSRYRCAGAHGRSGAGPAPTDDFDFDMIMMIYPQSDTPGNELRDYLTCAAAKAQGSYNMLGICDPAVDALVERIVTAQDRDHATTRPTRWTGNRCGLVLVPNWDSWISTSPTGTASAAGTSPSARVQLRYAGGWIRQRPRPPTRHGSREHAPANPLPQGERGRGRH